MIFQLTATVRRVEECERNDRSGVRVQLNVAHDIPDVPSIIYLVRPSHEAKEFFVGQTFSVELKHQSEE